MRYNKNIKCKDCKKEDKQIKAGKQGQVAKYTSVNTVGKHIRQNQKKGIIAKK